MKYMGSKSRIVDNILPIIQERLRDYNIKIYIEPFCGGCNVIDKVQCDTKIASDNHKYLIEMFKNINQIQNLPEFITKEHYSDVRECFNKGSSQYPD
jgi:DNA adenine methylase